MRTIPREPARDTMNNSPKAASSRRRSRLYGFPALSLPVWILTIGRLLSQIGTGFTLFSAPIFFSQDLGLSSGLIGLGLGLGSLMGVAGRIFSGTLADRPRIGRKPILLASAGISALADLCFATAQGWSLFLMGNLLMGFGIGLYWPAMEAAVADLTTEGDRNEAFALSRLGDNLGLGLGVICGGWLMVSKIPYAWLFWADGVSFIVFAGLVSGFVRETVAEKTDLVFQSQRQGWKQALGDRTLQQFIFINILFTLYLSQVQSTLPLFLSQTFIKIQGSLSSAFLSSLFTIYVFLTAVLQLPVARFFRRRGHLSMLKVSIFCWGLGFLSLAALGLFSSGINPGFIKFWSFLSLLFLSLGTVCYLPAASAFVAALAPAHLRGIYLSINSQCWAIGYFLGPPLGGWALDTFQTQSFILWFSIALSTPWGWLKIQQLQQQQQLQSQQNH